MRGVARVVFYVDPLFQMNRGGLFALNQTDTTAWQQTVLQLQQVSLEGGGVLPEVAIDYRTWGSLNRTGTNAVLICHALTGDARAGATAEGAGWWEGLIGAGKAFDPAHHFILCANVLGGCSGSTGPHSLDPRTGRPYGSAFPVVTIRDMVHVQHELVTHLGIRMLSAVVGGSMGGMQAIEWAMLYPDMVRRCIPIATSAGLSALALAYNDAMRTAILNDPEWRGGDYYDSDGPVRGLSLARKIGMITYRSFALFERRFGRTTTEEGAALAQTQFQMNAYLAHHGRKLVDRFDAGSYLRLLQAMDLHDIGRGRGGVAAALQRLTAEVLWIGIDSDRLYPAEEQRRWVEQLQAAGKRVTYREIVSPYGHDAFLIEDEQLDTMVREWVANEEEEQA